MILSLILVYRLVLASLILAFFAVKTSRADYDCSAKDDGWYYDPEFCHIYWRCIHGTAEEFECASGTAWDHHENRCNWLDSVDCSRAEKTTTEAVAEEDGDDHDESSYGNEHGHDHEVEEEEEPPTTTRRSKRKKNSKKRMLQKKDDGYHMI